MYTPSTGSAVARPGALTALVLLATAGVLWGTGGLLGRLLDDTAGLGPAAVAAYRLVLGGGLLGVALLVLGRLRPRGIDAWRRIALIGVLAALYQLCFFAAIALTSVSLAVLVTIGSAPVIVIAVERLTNRRGPDRRLTVSVILALAGLALLVGVPTGAHTAGAVAAGAALALASGAGFAGITLLAARPVPGLDDLTTTAWAFLLGGALLVPVAVGTTGLAFAPEPTTAVLLLALALVPTALAYLLYFRGLRGSVAGVGAVMALLEPLTGAVLAGLLLGDRLGVTGIIGALLLGGAVVLTARAQAEGVAVRPRP